MWREHRRRDHGKEWSCDQHTLEEWGERGYRAAISIDGPYSCAKLLFITEYLAAMILETLEVHNSPNSRLFRLRPTVAQWRVGRLRPARRFFSTVDNSNQRGRGRIEPANLRLGTSLLPECREAQRESQKRVLLHQICAIDQQRNPTYYCPSSIHRAVTVLFTSSHGSREEWLPCLHWLLNSRPLITKYEKWLTP